MSVNDNDDGSDNDNVDDDDNGSHDDDNWKEEELGQCQRVHK